MVCLQAATRKGSGCAWDQNRLIHEIWTQVCTGKGLCGSEGVALAVSGTGEWDTSLD